VLLEVCQQLAEVLAQPLDRISIEEARLMLGVNFRVGVKFAPGKPERVF
jgi:hypothetical protein